MVTEEQWADLYDSVLEKPKEIARIFMDYFGGDNVALRFAPLNSFIEYVNAYFTYDELDNDIGIAEGNNHFLSRIIVRFPEVAVTNELGDSTVIKELYVEIPVSVLGRFASSTFRVARSHYTYIQWVKGYIHSHAHVLNKANPGDFSTCCLGSGPIRNTISELATDCNMDKWLLFCIELSKYVTVESVAGVPYIYIKNLVLEETGNNIGIQWFDWRHSLSLDIVGRSILGEFVKWLINSHTLELSFNGRSYDLAYSYYDFRVRMSNWFIHWYNSGGYNIENLPYQELLRRRFFIRCKVLDNKFIALGRERLNSVPEPQKLFEFNGRDVMLHVDEPLTEEEEDVSIFLSQNVTSYLYVKLIKIINYEYGCKVNQQRSTSSKVSYMF